MAPRRSTRTAKAVERVETSVFSSFPVRVLIAGAVVFGGAYVIGTSDGGQINVAATVYESNERITEAGGTLPAGSVPPAREDLRGMPNGGLVPAESQSAPEPVPAPAPEPEATTTTGGAEGGEPSAESGEASVGEGEAETTVTE